MLNGTVPYSNTISSVLGEIKYATVDAGYAFFRGAGYKFGAFVGYNYYNENKSASGCTQIANQLSDCVPPIDSSVLVLQFNGTDDHLQRVPPFISPESGTGIGLQLESILSYLVTDQFSAGIGGRYWAMWTTMDAIIEFAGAPCPCLTQPAKTDRFGVFVQLDYRGVGSLLEGFR